MFSKRSTISPMSLIHPILLLTFTTQLQLIIPQLERLSLSKGDINTIRKSRFKQDFFFNVKVLRISLGIGGESAIFPISILRRFYNLEKLVLTYCSLEELFPAHGHGKVEEEEEQKHFETQLSRIKTLKLEYITNLRQVWRGDSSSVLPNLETLKVIRGDDLISLSTSTVSFKNLTTLEVWCCNKMENLVSVATVQSLVNVKSMTVSHCLKLREIVGSQEDLTQDPIIFSSLRYLKLECLIRLACFCSGKFIFDFPYLEQLIVEQCPKLEIFSKTDPITPRLLQVQGRKLWNLEGDLNATIQRMYTAKVGFICLMNLSLSEFPELIQNWQTRSLPILDFRYLLRLDICNCNSLGYLLTPSMVRSLVQLYHLEVKHCTRMDAVIMEEGTENLITENKIILPCLSLIILESCSDLTSFCVGSCTFQCAVLTRVEVLNCPKMTTFVSTFPRELEKENPQAFFSSKVAFPNLEWMTITHLKNLEIIWHSKLYADSFCRLKSLTIVNCEKLSVVFPSADIEGRIWKSLEELIINQCGSLEGIFEIDKFNVKQTQDVIDTKLRKLIIADLARLKHVWNKDPQGLLSFHNLESVEVSYCQSLKILFPTSIGKSLLQLQKLHLYRCGVEEIVTIGEQGVEAIVNFQFPRVSSLKLEALPRLQCFYPGKHTTVWPMLKEFCFSHFNQAKRTDGHGQLDFPVRLPLFSIKKIIHQLEKLSLARHDIAMICEHESKQDILFNIKVLQIQGYLDDELDVLPVGFLRRFCHLENLVVTYCNFKELFPSKGEVEEQEKHIEIETLSRIKTLKLQFLPYLKHIWSHDSTTGLQNLETLDILRCDSLIILSNSISSFQNLTTLSVINCKGMINLVSISIAQSLVQLKSMTVERCYMLTDIVGNEGDGMQDFIVITFTKLKFLRLQRLPRLESFCSKNFTFKFPCLEEVTMNQCPKLKIFSEGDLNTPLLQRVLIEEENKCRWEGDLNTTIQRMYMEEVGFAKLQLLMLSNFPKFMETWHITNPHELLDFRQLQVLEICNCSKFRYLLTHSMAMGLVQLFRLIVKNCGTMEQVIMGEGAENKMEFPHLWLINLESCLDLTSFYVGSHSLELPRLNDFIVKDCPKMVTCAASTSSEEHDKEESQYLFSSKVETPNLEFLSLSSNNIQHILDNSISRISSYVQNLRELCVEGCDNLKYLLTSSMVKSFERLNWLKIGDCNMMEEVILVEESMDEETICKIFFPNLEFLLLQDLPKLKRFCFGNYLELPCLWKLKISKCPVLKSFISSFIFGDMIASSKNVKNTCTLSLFDAKVTFPKLERLVIEHVKSLNKIWNEQLEVDSFCHLTLVSVVSCEKLMNIFPFSMVGRLQRLDKLRIWNCDLLEEILESREPGVSQSQAQKATPLPLLETVTCLEDDMKDGIVFSKLKYLQLCGLPRFSSFCSVKCKFEFPFLEEVILMDCPRMQTFSMDETRTPKLQKVKLTADEDEGFWDGNLNSTIQLHFTQKSQRDSENEIKEIAVPILSK
ncbi:hypothetical protein SLEP1_g50651 [Rubroshorea leprosula]|uniref:Disease resistance protein At4g27190-like leucine-rich repeats domain-containing protein n=1 Tax=Rubroshorea leprosula TaxID=152421 RepID=A0AAV5M1M0_9ROSI|nr:hypothetical protein SLEP1_g50651 [Rubroshorea leprosula]